MSNFKQEKNNSRPLTTGEIALAKSVFGDSIDYSKVKIFNGKYIPFQKDDISIAPNGNIYSSGFMYSDDYSKTSKSHFIHEMTHVWQYQNNILNPVSSFLQTLVTSGFKYNHTYQFVPDSKKDLSEYSMEQQAEIVAAYATALHREKEKPFDCVTAKAALDKQLENFSGSNFFAGYALQQSLKKGTIALDDKNHPHATDKYCEAYKVTMEEDKKKEAAISKVLTNFARDPSYLNPEKGPKTRVSTNAPKL